MAKFIDTHPYTFAEFVSKYKRFQIPPFQRVYTWKPKQVNDLWESVKSNEKGYFIGTLVTIEGTEDTDNRISIIDGQQRLFTISLFLLAIRDELKSFKRSAKSPLINRVKGIIEDIERDYLYYRETGTFEISKKESKLVLRPGKRNLRDIYSELIGGSVDMRKSEKYDENQKRFIKNYQNIAKLIKQEVRRCSTDNEKIASLIELANKISSLTFINILAATDSDAYSLFEGLNSTGVGLSVADLVKNAVMSSAKGNDAKNLVEEEWSIIESLFEKTSVALFPRFLRHQWISRNGYINTSQLFDRIKKTKLEKHENSEITDYTREISSDANLYIGVRFFGYDINLLSQGFRKQTVLILRKFGYLDSDQVYEVILSYLNKKITDQNYSFRQLNRDLERLWIFCFRAKILAINPSEYERRFADHCKYVSEFTKKETDRMTDKFYSELSMLVKNRSSFLENFASDLEYKESGNNDLIKYILEEIFSTKNPNIKVANPTLEHIIPRDPSKWQSKEIGEFVHNIGNITLLNDRDNQLAGNASIEDKVNKIFRNDPFTTNKEIVQMEDIFKKNPIIAIKRRSEQYAKTAAMIWNSDLKPRSTRT